MLNLKSILIIDSNSLTDFISFWSKQYYYPKFEEKYNSNIVKEQFVVEDIIALYEWKNGMRLSIKKQESVNNKIISKIEIINSLKNEVTFDLELFKNEFKNLTAVWKIFLLHIIQPKIYPIYDQHIHRAYAYIHNEDYSRILNTLSDKKKEAFYFGPYLDFIEKHKIKDLKKLDEAFFAFGQFINTKNYVSLLK